MSTGIHGHGSSLKIGPTTAATNLTSIGNIITIAGPDETRDPIDISTMDSTAKWREFIPGMIDAGEVTVDLNFDGTTVAALLHAQLTATAQSIVITAGTGGDTFTANGFITALGHAIPFDDKITQSVTLKFTGGMTHANV